MSDTSTSTPPGPIIAQWKDGWSCHFLEARLGVRLARSYGAWMLKHHMYSEGTDFTSRGIRGRAPDKVGNSTLRKLWKGTVGSMTEDFELMRSYVLMSQGGRKPQGVVTWTLPDPNGEPPVRVFWKDPAPGKKTRLEMPVLRLGHLMAFIKPEHRGQGLARRVLDEIMMPQIEEHARCAAQLGAMPLLGASDAMEHMLRTMTGIPIVQTLTHGADMREEAWRAIMRSRLGANGVACPYKIEPRHAPLNPADRPAPGPRAFSGTRP